MNSKTLINILATMVLLPVTMVHAATVTFSAPTYSNNLPNQGFGDVSQTDNTLEIDVSDFDITADSSMPFITMLDTIAYTVTAPDNYYIKSIGYTEGLWTKANIGNLGGSGLSFADGSLTVTGQTSTLGQHLWSAPVNVQFNMGTSISTQGQPASVSVSLTNQITAVAFGGGDAWIAKGWVDDDQDPNTDPIKQMPTLTVDIAVVPLPPAVWLFGTALVGLFSTSRYRSKVSS